ncbi:MAG: BrnT family toxin [Clostridia bacterium]|nr:BrnT family toxin [Clostridia bacterium]MBR1704263.1 BrnT family toxin [Clostridia bacterium]
MDQLFFDWDENKNQKNIKKHGISFQEASSVFFDNNAVVFDDPDHSLDEVRFLVIGIIETVNRHLKTLRGVVSYCELEDNHIRIISARKATKREEEQYYRYLGGEYYER